MPTLDDEHNKKADLVELLDKVEPKEPSSLVVVEPLITSDSSTENSSKSNNLIDISADDDVVVVTSDDTKTTDTQLKGKAKRSKKLVFYSNPSNL